MSDDILKIKREIESEVFGEEQTWSRVENNVSLWPNFICFLNYLFIFLYCCVGCLVVGNNMIEL